MEDQNIVGERMNAKEIESIYLVTTTEDELETICAVSSLQMELQCASANLSLIKEAKRVLQKHAPDKKFEIIKFVRCGVLNDTAH